MAPSLIIAQSERESEASLGGPHHARGDYRASTATSLSPSPVVGMIRPTTGPIPLASVLSDVRAGASRAAVLAQEDASASGAHLSARVCRALALTTPAQRRACGLFQNCETSHV